MITSALTPIDITITSIAARMAAKINFRIQITSFAAQTCGAEGPDLDDNLNRRSR